MPTPSFVALMSASSIRQHPRLRNLIEAIPETDWTPIPYWMDGAADVAETIYTPFDSRRRTSAPHRPQGEAQPGSQLAFFTNYSYHGFITDREGVEADHRRHAEVEDLDGVTEPSVGTLWPTP